ncbi:DUF6221 family protein [Streptomyces cyaneofuscatus]|uniref:DUF6221 family protein n=1 Tax=Streptomyces cyaneofuscatus TaxID=66883 RepID=UPI0033A8A6CE
MTKLAELEAFVEARLAEAERWAADPAKASEAAVRSAATYAGISVQMASAALNAGIRTANGPLHPEHVHADVQAKRALLGFLKPSEVYGHSVYLLALAYETHPDFKGSWKL